MLLSFSSTFRNLFPLGIFILLSLAIGSKSYGQVGISGPTNVVKNNSYTYYPTYNGSSSNSYYGSYSYTITGGVVSGTSNTSKSGTCSGVLYSIGINVTWTSTTGSLYFTCGLGSKTIYISAANALQPGTISPSSQNINYGASPSIITGTAATGGATSPSYSYQWMNSSNGSIWSDVSGAVGLNYSPPVLYSSTYYKRRVTETVSSSIGYTNTAFVNVYPQVVANISPATQNIIAGTSAATITSSVSGGNSTYSYQWQSSLNNITWTNTVTTSSYSPGIVNTITYYRLIVTSNGAKDTSNIATVNTCTTPTDQITGPNQCVKGSTIQLAHANSGGTWSSSNNGIATVDGSGVVTGKESGDAIISYSFPYSCGTFSVQLGINVVPFSTISPSLGTGILDPIATDTIPLTKDSVRSLQFKQDTLYSAAHQIKNVLAFKIIEESSKFIPGDFLATAVLKLEYGHSSGEINKVDSIRLSVSYNKSAGTKYNALNYFTFNNAEFTRVTVLRIEAPTIVNGISFDTKQVLLLTNSIIGTRYYQLPSNKKPTLSFNNPAQGNIPDGLQVSWLFPDHTLNNGVQLEWAWLEKDMVSSYSKNNVFDTALLFKTNSTRVDLPGGTLGGGYNIPLLYGDTGRLYMRVRGVNLMPNGSRSDGPWSGIQSFAFNGHNQSLNWQSNTTYAEDGKRKSVVQYFDGSLRSRQTVTKDNTTGNTVVAETFYDGQGRPSVQVLPAPGISNIIAYTKNLNKFNGQPDNTDPSDYFDFKTPALGNYATGPLNDSFGTAKYYSTKNPDFNTTYHKNIPVANGFAYTVTRYTPDATGRIMRQGGVGDSMQIGGNHATKYYYGTAAQEELNALFGTEVGNYTHYFKNMVQDANGQMSVSYVDMQGRTIATALAGETPTGLQALAITDTAKYKNQAGKKLTRNLLDKGSNILKGNSIESINSLLVPFQTQYEFEYNLSSQTLQMPKCGGGTVSYTCKFDLQISVSDESGDSNPIVYNFTGISSKTFLQSLVLQAGSYNIRKTLTINEDSLQKFIRQYDSLGFGICQTRQYLTDSIASADSAASGCGISGPVLTSNTCLTSLKKYTDYLNDYAKSLGYASSNQLNEKQVNDIRNQYVNDSSFCASLNANTSFTLPSIRKQMLADMIPYSGQYAIETGSDSMYKKYNIFRTTGNPNFTQPFFKYPRLLRTGAASNYFNFYGNIDSSVLLSRLVSMTKSDFKQEFKESWAKSLLPYHPEFNKLKFAEDSLGSVFNFVDSIHASVNTAFNPINADPFFSVFSSTTDKNLINKYSDTTWQGGYSMWQLAYAEAFGCKAIIDTTNRKNCLANMPKSIRTVGTLVNTGSGAVTLTSAIQLNAWNMYKAFYTVVRSEMVNRYINVRPGTNDTLDNRNLITKGYRLHFPYDNVQQAQNSGWTNWFPNQNGVYPSVSLSDSVKTSNNRCESYINSWKKAFLDCPSLNAMSTGKRDSIIISITSKLLQVCKNGTDGANPYGASSVAPAFSNATFTSFEQAVNFVFDSAGIARTLYCNPYSIEFPKPYGKNQQIAKTSIASIDTCNCTQFTKLQAEITAAGINADSLAAVNQYLLATYQDTLSTVLFQALRQCSQPYLFNCRDSSYTCYPHGVASTCTIRKCDTLYASPLSSPQPLPVFLQCGFSKTNYNCYDCNSFKGLDSSFYVLFNRHPVFSGSITSDSTMLYNDLFARYVNFKTGLQKNWAYYAARFKEKSCGIGGLSGDGIKLNICLERTTLNDTTGLVQYLSPCQVVRNRSTVKAAIIYESIRQQTLANFRSAYLNKLVTTVELFKVKDTIKEYHYTLYYYDQAGNLIKTVPPKGVNPIYRQSWLDSVETAKLQGTRLVPDHGYATRYNYNSLNQVVLQKTPDAGSSRFYYDRLGRLAVSQNARQAGSGNVYSYTFYDSLGRITQVGQLTAATAISDAVAKSQSSLQSWFNNSTTRNQITRTVYDTAYGMIHGVAFSQQHLRNRVSYSQLINDSTNQHAASATYYSYDIHGNVDTLLQDFGYSQDEGIPNPMNQSSNRFKKIVYDYDLVSGKVNQVSYQPGAADAYYHRYSYDAENRLTEVYSGRDSVMLLLFPEREAKYNYYKHGPLAQAELGQLRVQKLDHAYTLQGWLKAINPTMGGTLANGTDTTEAYPVAQDVFGFSLHYYKGDYKAIGYTPQATSVLGGLGTNAAPLYNGNIAAMAVNIPKLGSTKVYNYHYDQLNRIVAMDLFNGLNVNAGTFTAGISTDYQERISYDPNGNILTYLRNGDSYRLSMDNLSYFYKSGTNQLHKVTDGAADASANDYSKYNDLRQGQADNNYQYDEIGNLTSDAKDTLTSITWNVYGKIQSITKNGKVIRYIYDAAGNRIFKYTPTDTTAYVRDASGNVLSVYSRPAGQSPLVQSETHLYGSSRLGIATRHLAADTSIVLSGGFGFGQKSIFTRGEKLFELSNHLGNVLATIADRRIPVDANSDGTIESYTADMVSAQDYYPFGMQMPGRKYAASAYRYGFNGKEKDGEIKGEGNSYEFTFRIYDPRTGRFLSVDPIGKNYPHSSPYAFAENDVIRSIDLEGLEKYTVTGRSFIPMATLDNPWYTPNFSASSFAGDNRTSYQLNTTAYRTEQKVHADFDNRTVTYSSNKASGTKALDKAGKVIETSKEAAAGPVPTFDKAFLQNGNSVTIHMSIDAPNRLVAGAPAINYQFDVTITPSADKKSFEYQIKGATDGFPAYELWITDETNKISYLLVNRTPTETGETPRALFPPMEYKFDLKGDSKTETPAEKVDFKNKKNTPEKK